MTGECTNADAGYGEWHLNDGSGIGVIDDVGYDAIGDSLTADGGATYAPLLRRVVRTVCWSELLRVRRMEVVAT